jgi:hypothetical protein
MGNINSQAQGCTARAGYHYYRQPGLERGLERMLRISPSAMRRMHAIGQTKTETDKKNRPG